MGASALEISRTLDAPLTSSVRICSHSLYVLFTDGIKHEDSSEKESSRMLGLVVSCFYIRQYRCNRPDNRDKSDSDIPTTPSHRLVQDNRLFQELPKAKLTDTACHELVDDVSLNPERLNPPPPPQGCPPYHPD